MSRFRPPPIPKRKTATTGLRARRVQLQLEALATQFRAAMATAEYAVALQLAQTALAHTPGNVTILGDYALCLMRTGRHEDAYRVYMQIHDAPPAHRARASDTWLDGLAEVCGWLGKCDELRRHGHRSLADADEKFRHGTRWPLPAVPPRFDPDARTRNVIAYSLYGANPRYCETAVMNARVAHELYPAWTCRVYLDGSVPEHVQHRLRDAGAELVAMDRHERRAIPGTLWRFLIMDDPGVDRFIVRDADSLLSEREVAAVDEWLASDRLFHHMRDYFTHTELLLAGLWGGCTRVIPPVAQLISDFLANYRGPARFTDQQFLRTVLWPTVRESIMNHDELFGFHDARPFPAHAPVRWRTDRFHVGSNTAYASIGGPSSLPDGARQPIALVHAGKAPLAYDAPVRQHSWALNLPFFLADEFRSGKLRVIAR
ncbi:tetratricopeptide repeat protein [Burkholderia sp. 572]|uniref:tetratricopeptide repeat protein n=1 Tax=Burkholderia sp. 572 TaxID=3156414 RepID=UPI00339906A5